MTTVGVQWVNVLEGHRHNIVTEGQATRELDIKQSSLDETIRHNKVSESQAWEDVTSRRMQANAAVTQAQVAQDRLKLDTIVYQTVTRPQAEANIAKLNADTTLKQREAANELLKSRNLKAEEKLTEAKIGNTKANTAKTYVNIVTDIADSVSKGITAISNAKKDTADTAIKILTLGLGG